MRLARVALVLSAVLLVGLFSMCIQQVLTSAASALTGQAFAKIISEGRLPGLFHAPPKLVHENVPVTLWQVRTSWYGLGEEPYCIVSYDRNLAFRFFVPEDVEQVVKKFDLGVAVTKPLEKAWLGVKDAQRFIRTSESYDSFPHINREACAQIAGAEERLLASLRSTEDLLYSIGDVALQDLWTLDLLGADQNESGSAHAVFIEITNVVVQPNATEVEETVWKNAAYCTSLGQNLSVSFKTKCLFKKLQNLYAYLSAIESSPIRQESVDIFNEALGFGKDSLLEEYVALHASAQESARQMYASFSNALSNIDTNHGQTESLLKQLEKAKASEVGCAAENAITSETAELWTIHPTASQQECVSVRLRTAGRALADADAAKRRATRLVSPVLPVSLTLADLLSGELVNYLGSRKDNFLYDATQELETHNARLSNILEQLRSAEDEMNWLLERAKTAYDRLLEENKQFFWAPGYEAAVSEARLADESDALGDKVYHYSRAVSRLSELKKNPPGKWPYAKLELADKAAKNLDKLGIDVAWEQTVLETLEKQDASAAAEVERLADGLLEKMRLKLGLFPKLGEARGEAQALLASGRAFLAEPGFASEIDEKKFLELDAEFSAADLKDALFEGTAMLNTYEKIALFLKPALQRAAEKALFVEEKIFSSAGCGWLQANVLLVVANNHPISLTGISFSHEFAAKLRNADGPGSSGSAVSMKLDLGPEEKKRWEYEAEAFIPCTNSSLSGPVSGPVQGPVFVNYSNNTIIQVFQGKQNLSTLRKLLKLEQDANQLCPFSDCRSLKRQAEEANDAWEEKGTDKTPVLEKLLDNQSNKILSDLNSAASFSASKRLLDAFEKAADTKTSLGPSLFIFSEKDFSDAQQKYSNLKTISDALDKPIATGFSGLETLSQKFSSASLKSFEKDAALFEDFLNASLARLRSDAAAALFTAKKAVQDAQSAGRQPAAETQDLLEKALESFEKGYYNRATAYAAEAKQQTVSAVGISGSFTSQFPTEYALGFFALIGFGVFLFKRPKKQAPHRMIRRIDFD